MQINIKLKKYIEEFVFPEYNKNESGHGINHIKDVIKTLILFYNTLCFW